MGHDISAYIKTKYEPTPYESYAAGNTDAGEISYFRIGGFNKLRQRLFYSIIPGSDVANAGFSGDGSLLDFTRDDISKAIEACKYLMEDETALREILLSPKYSAEETAKQFRGVLEAIFANEPSAKIIDTNTTVTVDEIRKNIADVWKFCDNIIFAYDVFGENARGIQIYFG